MIYLSFQHSLKFFFLNKPQFSRRAQFLLFETRIYTDIKKKEWTTNYFYRSQASTEEKKPTKNTE